MQLKNFGDLRNRDIKYKRYNQPHTSVICDGTDLSLQHHNEHVMTAASECTSMLYFNVHLLLYSLACLLHTATSSGITYVARHIMIHSHTPHTQLTCVVDTVIDKLLLYTFSSYNLIHTDSRSTLQWMSLNITTGPWM